MTKLTIIDNETDFYELKDGQEVVMHGGEIRFKGVRTTTIRVDQALGIVEGQCVILQSKHPELNGAKTATFVTVKPSEEHGDGTVTWPLQIVSKH